MAVPSLTSEFLDSKDVTPEVEFNIKWAAASLYSGTSYPLCLMKRVICLPGQYIVLSIVPPGGADTVRLSNLGSPVHDH